MIFSVILSVLRLEKKDIFSEFELLFSVAKILKFCYFESQQKLGRFFLNQMNAAKPTKTKANDQT